MAKKSVKTHELSALRMPGFKAEMSLYTSPTTYRSAGSLGGSIGAVQPAYGSDWCTSPFCRRGTTPNGDLVCICHFPM
jgi:hypothetical protein